ncbi:MAG TPA: aminotransferase class V-fold PLP-dependent enzyme, partial [Candidatus Polarisedimenticolia bacterium]|nr:aminotransferase class V-fold PLP-dependent enzyme [Candidatus Polarisedimenticolia bacterium]
NGAAAPRLPNTISLTVPGAAADALVIALDLAGFAVSTGSACSTGAGRPSHVLSAMGLPGDEAASTIRISLGPATTAAELADFAQALQRAAAAARAGAARLETPASGTGVSGIARRSPAGQA